MSDEFNEDYRRGYNAAVRFYESHDIKREAELIVANHRIKELENNLFEMTKLCHKYQDELWINNKEKVSKEQNSGR